MAEIGASGTVIIGAPDIDIDGGGGGSSGTIFMKRQSGVVGVGPVSLGGEIQSFGDTHTGQSLNSTNVMFNGVKGAYNANIDQDFTNSITTDPSGGSTITPYVLYGNDPGVEPSPLVTNISLHEFLDENFSVNINDAQSNPSHRKKASNNIGGFTGNGYGNFTDPPTLSNAGPSSLSEIMNSVPHDPLSINGNQAEPLGNLDLLEVDLGVETSPTGTGGINGISTGTSAITVQETTGTKNGVGTSGNVMSGTGGGKILCTTIYETTGFKDWKIAGILWNKHLDKHLTKYHQIGYHKIFFQFTRLMKKNKYIFNLGKYMVTQRTRDIKAIMDNKKRHIPGMVVRYIFEPLSFCVGYISEKLKKRGK